MREIKFRAWDKYKKQMSPVCDISFGDDGRALTVIFQTAPKEKYYRGLVDGENGILMQFTGLLDKQGKEIYEGDIVFNRHNSFKGVVFFDRGSYWVRELFTHVDEGVYDGDIEKETQWSIDLDYEVIDNIYENPELVQAKP